MFVINDDLSIYVTRGDSAAFTVTSSENGVNHVFQPGDVVRLKVYGKKDAENIVLQKDFPVLSESETVSMYLSERDTKFGDVISKPTDYWYEVELNPFTNPQTIIGYDEDGAKIFRLYPEGADVPEIPVDPEVVKVIDDELDLTSTRPVQNQAIARAVAQLRAKLDATSNAAVQAGQDVVVERARIDNLVASAVAPADADANYLEVADIRVGADGENYGSAGTAVREQIKALRNTADNRFSRYKFDNGNVHVETSEVAHSAMNGATYKADGNSHTLTVAAGSNYGGGGSYIQYGFSPSVDYIGTQLFFKVNLSISANLIGRVVPVFNSVTGVSVDYYELASDSLVFAVTLGKDYIRNVTLNVALKINEYSTLSNAGTMTVSDWYCEKHNVLETVYETIKNAQASSRWMGKKIATIGDSLTQMGYWQPMLEDVLGVECEIIAQSGGNMTAIAHFVESLDSDKELLTVWAGTNDFANGIPLGQFGSTDTNTYAGALHKVVRQCSTNFPNMKLLFITPMQRHDSIVSGWETDKKGQYINNATGNTLEDYANMMIEYGKAYAIPVLDMYHESGVNKYNIAAYCSDLLHPTKDGFLRLCWKIINKIESV